MPARHRYPRANHRSRSRAWLATVGRPLCGSATRRTTGVQSRPKAVNRRRHRAAATGLSNPLRQLPFPGLLPSLSTPYRLTGSARDIENYSVKILQEKHWRSPFR
jgi:hypothetical protein